MTARERIRAKPTAVRIVLEAYMRKAALDDNSPEWECYGAAALKWWKWLVAEFHKDFGYIDMSERASEGLIAEAMLEEFCKQEVWRKILRGMAS